MATLDLHEQEQVDAIKAWWKENGKWLVAALLLAACGFAAVRGWHIWQANQSREAAKLYAGVVQQVASNDPKRVGDAALAVVDKFGSSAYAPRAQLLAAQVSIQAKDTDHAKIQLQWVIDHATEEGLQSVARLKLASLLLDEKKYADALGLLNAKHPESFDGLYADLKGDVLFAEGKPDEARAAYKVALDKTDEKSMYRNLIQMKLDSLGGVK
ncbi:MAG: tetratricopeptide repeat protein [Gammaproteobacteria bacterium]|nr:tetratricopeptide repeat protein [Gammaproteobacteria bacterium]